MVFERITSSISAFLREHGVLHSDPLPVIRSRPVATSSISSAFVSSPHPTIPSISVRNNIRYFSPRDLELRDLQLACVAAIVLTRHQSFEENTGSAWARFNYRMMFGENTGLHHPAISPAQFEALRLQVISGRSVSEAMASQHLSLENFGLTPRFIRSLDNPHQNREEFIQQALEEVRYLGNTAGSIPGEPRRAYALFSILNDATRDVMTLEERIPEIRSYLGGEERLSTLRREIENPVHWALLVLGIGAAEVGGSLAATYVSDNILVTGAARALAFPIPSTLAGQGSYRENFVAGIPIAVTGPLGRAIVAPVVERVGAETVLGQFVEFGGGAATITGTNILMRPNDHGSFAQEFLLGMGQESQGRMSGAIWQSGSRALGEDIRILGDEAYSQFLGLGFMFTGLGPAAFGRMPRSRRPDNDTTSATNPFEHLSRLPWRQALRLAMEHGIAIRGGNGERIFIYRSPRPQNIAPVPSEVQRNFDLLSQSFRTYRSGSRLMARLNMVWNIYAASPANVRENIARRIQAMVGQTVGGTALSSVAYGLFRDLLNNIIVNYSHPLGSFAIRLEADPRYGITEPQFSIPGQYKHYTDQAGLNRILQGGRILLNAPIPGRQQRVYVTDLDLTPEEVFRNIFLQNSRYHGRGRFVLSFDLSPNVSVQSGGQQLAVVNGSPVFEMWATQSLVLGRDALIRYAGENPILDDF